MGTKQAVDLKRGWTTGACAAAAAKAACAGLLNGGAFPDPVTITLPGGQQPAFALARCELFCGDKGAGSGADEGAMAAIVKDAGDDPDVTHGALIEARVTRGRPGEGVQFRAGAGVGMVTLPGLPLAPGEPAINPKPREMITRALKEVSPDRCDFIVEISVPGGVEIARKTLNGRLGIIGGISILGTTGIVIPFSCAAWIASIHRGVDVALATGQTHVAAATGDTSEKAVQQLYGLNERQLIDMGDFVGGTLKYIKAHPVPRVTIAGGVGKMTKLAQGLLDLHSKRGRADMDALAELVLAAAPSTVSAPVATAAPAATAILPPAALADRAAQLARLAEAVRRANTVAEAFDHARAADVPLGDLIAARAWAAAAQVLGDRAIALEIILFDHKGEQRGHAPFAPVTKRKPDV